MHSEVPRAARSASEFADRPGERHGPTKLGNAQLCELDEQLQEQRARADSPA